MSILNYSAVVVLLTALPLLALEPGMPDAFPRKKLIAAGWDSPSPEELVEHLALIETLPLDGLRVSISIPTPGGGQANFYRIMQEGKWERKWFQESVDNLKKAKSAKLTENFLSVGAGLGVCWFDDEKWDDIVEHFGIAAWIAKEGGLRGLLFNPEVGISLPAFSYHRQLSRDRYSFAEYASKVRERGRAIMKAMAKEYPDMVFFTMFLNGGHAYSYFYQHGGPGDRLANWQLNNDKLLPSGPHGPLSVQEQIAPLERIEGGSYNLLPAFLNGLLDAVPAEMEIVDGLEQTYVTTQRESFLRWAYNVHSLALPMVVPENRRKYRAQVEAGFGIYLDAYANPEGSRHYVGPNVPGGSRTTLLRDTLQTALAVSDRYVWLWGEKHRWLPVERRKYRDIESKTWDEAIPGAIQALREARDPGLRAETRFRREAAKMEDPAGNKLQNQLANSDFETASTEAWAPGDANSKITHDAAIGSDAPGSLKLSGGPRAMAQTEIPTAKGSGIYGVRARIRQEGGAKAYMRIRWKKNDGPLLYQTSNAIFLYPAEPPKDGEWANVEAIVAVPLGLNRLVLQAVSEEGATAGGSAWFDDIEIYRLRP